MSSCNAQAATLVRCHRPRRRTGCRAFAGHDRVVTHSAPLDPSPAERAGRVARRERKRTACRVGVQEKAPTLASLRFGLPSPLLAHARGGGMGTTGASSSSDETSRGLHTADVDGYRCAPPIRRIDVVGPVSSSAKADDPVPRGGLSGNRRHLLIPPPRNAQAGWHVVSESERRVGWGCKKRPPPWPRFAFRLPSPLLAHARGGGMGTTSAALTTAAITGLYLV